MPSSSRPNVGREPMETDRTELDKTCALQCAGEEIGDKAGTQNGGGIGPPFDASANSCIAPEAQTRSPEKEQEHKEESDRVLSSEAPQTLEERACAYLPDVACAFRAYAKEIYAPEWPNYKDGETQQYTRCFTPMARDLISVLWKEHNRPPEGGWALTERKALNLIKAACMSSGQIPPTYPWRISELFDNPEFRDAMLATFKDKLRCLCQPIGEEPSGSGTVCEADVKVNSARPGSPNGKAQHGKPGRKPNRRSAKNKAIDEQLRAIAEAVPKSHEEVFKFLESRVPIPNANPFKTAGGWLAGYQSSKYAASSWLSKAWSRLGLLPFPRGPK